MCNIMCGPAYICVCVCVCIVVWCTYVVPSAPLGLTAVDSSPAPGLCHEQELSNKVHCTSYWQHLLRQQSVVKVVYKGSELLLSAAR